jgi:RNA polymerase sigma-70 factor, ECF subfamily
VLLADRLWAGAGAREREAPGRCLLSNQPVQITDTDFERRVRENQRVVYQIAYSVLRNAADAEDVAQETFIRAHAKLAGLRDPARFRSWVSQISRRLALNRLRSDARARRREHVAIETDSIHRLEAGDRTEDRMLVARVCAEIERLPEKLREVMLLSAIEGLDHAAVAQLLGIPEGTVRSRLHLARKRLLTAIGR